MPPPIPNLNLNVNQTPISGISGASYVSTGSFFSKPTEFPDPQTLVDGGVQIDGLAGVLMVGAVAVSLALLLKGL